MRLEDLRRLFARSTSADPSEGEEPTASVAAIFREVADGVELLFIRRAEREGDPWSGHVAFPGGRRDPRDASSRATAIRETLEEVGIDLERSAEVVLDMAPLPTFGRAGGRQLVVRAHVFFLGTPDVAIAPNHEVADAIWVPIARFLSGEGRTMFSYPYQGVTYDLPSVDLGGHRLWGLTLRMVDDLVLLLGQASVSGSGET